MKVKAEEEASKLDGLDQYGRRQNLEFEGVSLTEDEDVVDLVVRIGKLVGAKVKRDDISTAHRLPPKRHCKVGDFPEIIARFISQNVRNEIYSKRAVVKSIDEKDLPLQNMKRKKKFIDKNLTQGRKRLLWLTKQKAKPKNFSNTWTMNGRIYMRKDDAASSITIQSEEDLHAL